MPDTEAARTDMRFASKYLENKQFSEAREYVASARRKDPNVTLAVKTESKTVAELTPNSLEADILVEQTRNYGEQIDALIVEMDKLSKKRFDVLDRNSEKLLKLDGMAYVEEYNKQQAEKTYDDQRYSEQTPYFDNRIDSLRSEIVKNLQEAIQLNPVPNFYALLGAVYVDQKNFAEAIELLTPIQQANPENFEIRRALDAAIKEHQLQQQLDAAPKTYHPAPSPPIEISTKVFLFSLSLGFLAIGLTAYLQANHAASEFTQMTIFGIGILLLIIAYFTRKWFR